MGEFAVGFFGACDGACAGFAYDLWGVDALLECGEDEDALKVVRSSDGDGLKVAKWYSHFKRRMFDVLAKRFQFLDGTIWSWTTRMVDYGGKDFVSI